MTPEAAPPPDRGPLAGLLAVLDLAPAGGGGATSGGEDRSGGGASSGALFTGTSQPSLGGRVFGGQVLGQAVVAASRTVTGTGTGTGTGSSGAGSEAGPARPLHSLHGYFLRPGDPAEPLLFAVEVLRDGRSFSARRVQVVEHGAPILSMICSFQAPEPGLDHAVAMPEVPGPEELPTTAQLLAGVDHPAARHSSLERPVDVRHVGSAVYLRVDDPAPAQAVWVRAAGALPDDDALHRAVLAYASDLTVLEPVLRRHGVPWSAPGLRAASLDHAMWWHRPARADEWLLFAQDSPSASGARGLGLGRFFTRDGALVASVAQEGVVRLSRA